MTSWAGIDPGLGGAIAIVGDDHEPLIADMPRSTDGWLDPVALRRILTGSPLRAVYLEQVGTFGTEGRSSLGSFLTAYGGIRATALLCAPVVLIAPVTWKTRLGLVVRSLGTKTRAERAVLQREGKERAMVLARELYPGAAHYLNRKKDHDRAEALLLAHLCKQENQS